MGTACLRELFYFEVLKLTKPCILGVAENPGQKIRLVALIIMEMFCTPLFEHWEKTFRMLLTLI